MEFFKSALWQYSHVIVDFCVVKNRNKKLFSLLILAYPQSREMKRREELLYVVE